MITYVKNNIHENHYNRGATKPDQVIISPKVPGYGYLDLSESGVTIMKNINLGIMAHVDAGKTTVSENLLYKTGVIKQPGRVDTGNTVTDSLAVERERGITVRASTVSFTWNNVKVNLLDTPGHVDFIAEVERSLRILDGAVLVISAKEGIQAQTRVIFDSLRKLKIPTIIFINKLDRTGTDLDKLYRDIRNSLTKDIVLMQDVEGAGTKDVVIKDWKNSDRLYDINTEIICSSDDILLEKYLDSGEISREDLDKSLSISAGKNSIYPVYHGSALHGLGIEELLNGIVSYIPEDTGNAEEELSAVVYKIDRDKNGQKKTWLRLFGGTLSIRESINIQDKDSIIKVKNLETPENGKIIQADYVKAGDIGILTNTDGLSIGDIIGISSPRYKKACLAVPTLITTITPVESGKRSELIKALYELTEEDPFLSCSIDEITEEITLHLFGEVQMEVIKSLIKERYSIDIDFTETSTLYKERPVGKGTAFMGFGSRNNPFAAGVGFTVEQGEPGSGFVYESAVSYGFITKSFLAAVYDGVIDAVKQGLYGWEITDIKVIFDQAQYNSVDSTPADYRNLAPMVLMEAIQQAGTGLMEPILSYELKIPADAVGKAINDIMVMRGTFDEPYAQDGDYIIKGKVPAETSKRYTLALASYTEGRGVFRTEFYGYEPYTGEIKTRTRKGYDPTNKIKYLLQKSNSIKV